MYRAVTKSLDSMLRAICLWLRLDLLLRTIYFLLVKMENEWKGHVCGKSSP